MPRWIDAFAGGGLPNGATYVVDGLEGAAMWLPPGVEPDVEEMMRIIDENLNDQAPDLLTVLEQMSGFHPSEACWYLPLMGVDPVMQGRGFGALQMRHGFEVMGTIQTGSSPVVTPMIRHPH
jgi:hypothetical protein